MAEKCPDCEIRRMTAGSTEAEFSRLRSALYQAEAERDDVLRARYNGLEEQRRLKGLLDAVVADRTRLETELGTPAWALRQRESALAASEARVAEVTAEIEDLHHSMIIYAEERQEWQRRAEAAEARVREGEETMRRIVLMASVPYQSALTGKATLDACADEGRAWLDAAAGATRGEG